MFKNFFIRSICLLFLIFVNYGWAENWPAIKEFKATHFISQESSKFSTELLTRSGYPAYILTCYPNGSKAGYDYKGLIQCVLMSWRDRNVDLMISDSDWNPNNVRSSFEMDARGVCAKHKYYGMTRNFYLRGMKITLKMSQLKFDSNLENLIESGMDVNNFSFLFEVDVTSAPRANSPYAKGFPEYCYVKNFIKDGVVHSMADIGRVDVSLKKIK